MDCQFQWTHIDIRSVSSECANFIEPLNLRITERGTSFIGMQGLWT
jgi:hypothetical protein